MYVSHYRAPFYVSSLSSLSLVDLDSVQSQLDLDNNNLSQAQKRLAAAMEAVQAVTDRVKNAKKENQYVSKFEREKGQVRVESNSMNKNHCSQSNLVFAVSLLFASIVSSLCVRSLLREIRVLETHSDELSQDIETHADNIDRHDALVQARITALQEDIVRVEEKIVASAEESKKCQEDTIKLKQEVSTSNTRAKVRQKDCRPSLLSYIIQRAPHPFDILLVPSNLLPAT